MTNQKKRLQKPCDMEIERINSNKRKRIEYEGEEDDEESNRKRMDKEFESYLLNPEMELSETMNKLIELFHDRMLMRVLETMTEVDRIAYMGNKKFLEQNNGSLHTIHWPDLECIRKEMPCHQELVELYNLVQGTPLWKKSRLAGTGASVASSRAGVGHYQSRRVLLLKTAQVFKEPSRPRIFFFSGHNTEPTVRDLVCLLFICFFGVKNCTITEIGILVNPLDPSEQVSPDGTIEGGKLFIPPLFAALCKFIQETTPNNSISADDFMAELKSTVNKNPVVGQAELDYLIQVVRQIFAAKYQSPLLFPNGRLKTHGILAMLHLPFDKTKIFDGPDLFQLIVRPDEEIVIKYYIVTRTQEFDDWFAERSKEFLDAYYNQDWFIEDWDHQKPFPIPKHDSIAVVGLGKLHSPLTVTYPGEPYGNMCILSGPGSVEPLAKWVFRHNLLLRVSKFKDVYIREPKILESMIHPSKLGGSDKKDHDKSDLSLPPMGMTIMEIGDPDGLNVTFNEQGKYASKFPLANDCLTRTNNFFELVEKSNQNTSLVLVIQMSCTNKEFRLNTLDDLKQYENDIYAVWTFLPDDFKKDFYMGVSKEVIKEWKTHQNESREKHILHPNVKTLISMRRSRMNSMIEKKMERPFFPWFTELFYVFLTKPLVELRDKIRPFKNNKITILPMFDGKSVDYKDLIKRETEMLEQRDGICPILCAHPKTFK